MFSYPGEESATVLRSPPALDFLSPSPSAVGMARSITGDSSVVYEESKCGGILPPLISQHPSQHWAVRLRPLGVPRLHQTAKQGKARQGRAEQSKYRIWDEGARNVSTTGLVKRFRTFDGG
jgi:hypothetical protein